MGGVLCPCNSQNKYRRLDSDLERKMLEAIRQRAVSRKNYFRSFNSIIMKFPRLNEGLRNVKNIFERYAALIDEDSNGTIDREELKNSLSEIEIHLTEKEIDNLYDSCSVDENKGIQFYGFIILLCLIYIFTEPANAHTTSRMGYPELEATFDTLIEVFLYLDKNGDGLLNKNDMIHALNEASSKEKAQRHIIMNRFKEMDWRRDGKVSFKEFLVTFIQWLGINTNGE